MALSPRDLARRLSEAGRVGGQTSGATKRERRRRYLAGEMGVVERREYERWLESCRAAGRRGGWPSHQANRSGREEQENGKAPAPKPKHTSGGG